MSEPDLILFCFDVESVGLHGEGFAVAGGTYNADGPIEEFCYSCPPATARGTAEDREWISENIPSIGLTHHTPFDVREAFWLKWREATEKYSNVRAIADCNWPVESRFLIRCVDDDSSRKWEGPYPLLDVGSLIIAKGGDPLQEFPRLEGETNKHHPLDDARQSARIAFEFLNL